MSSHLPLIVSVVVPLLSALAGFWGGWRTAEHRPRPTRKPLSEKARAGMSPEELQKLERLVDEAADRAFPSLARR